jgi:metal-responsive CopG/Arc/MetJ family transcriptional regulator
LETCVLRGPADKIKKLVEQLGALRGVKQAKLVVVKE